MKVSRKVWFVFAAILFFNRSAYAADQPPAQSSEKRSLFDGKTLDGWIQEPPYATTFSPADIVDMPSLVKKLTDKVDPLSGFVVDQLDDSTKAAMAAFSAEDAASAKAAKSSLTKALNKTINGPSIYETERFKNISLRPQTQELLKQSPTGRSLAHLNRLLLEDAFPNELKPSAASAWIVNDGAMASTGAGRGVIYTRDDFNKYRLTFTMRQVSGDHAPCFLIFCTHPAESEKPLDALGGIQFQVPNGSHWDYRPGKNKSGEGFTQVIKPKFDSHQWSRVEILVDATAGTGRMAVAQPVDAKAIEVLDYNVPEAGKTGPIAWQMHNGGIFDEYKDVEIEIDPVVNDLLTTK